MSLLGGASGGGGAAGGFMTFVLLFHVDVSCACCRQAVERPFLHIFVVPSGVGGGE